MFVAFQENNVLKFFSYLLNTNLNCYDALVLSRSRVSFLQLLFRPLLYVNFRNGLPIMSTAVAICIMNQPNVNRNLSRFMSPSPQTIYKF